MIRGCPRYSSVNATRSERVNRDNFPRLELRCRQAATDLLNLEMGLHRLLLLLTY